MPKALDVIVADDHESVADLIAIITGDRGHCVQTFYEGRGALEAALVKLPDVVFSDIRMPHVRGIEFAEQVLALAAQTKQRVLFVLMSATPEHFPATHPLRQKLHFLEKPFNLDAITNILDTAAVAEDAVEVENVRG